ncbi:MAG: CHASE2 domain-containing protein, partial [Nitrospiraceae bacterium]
MSAVRRQLQSPLTASLLIGTLVFLAIIGLRSCGSLESLELAAYDWYLRLRPEGRASDPRILLVTITEGDIRTQGRWPLTDATLSQVLGILTRYRPRVLGLDIYRDISVPPGREELDAVLTRNRDIITVMKFGEGASDGIPPPPVLKESDQIGFNDILVDRDGIVRRGLLFLDDEEGIAYSFAL